jgi:alpha-1,3-glucan synthase
MHISDVKGLRDHLDYLQNLGIKGIYIAGSPFVNEPWDFHGYNVLDFTLLDAHFGTIQDWRETIQAAHERGIYILADLTISTLGDQLGFVG